MNWIKLKSGDGEVRLVNMSHVLYVIPIEGGCEFHYREFRIVCDTPIGEIEDALAQLSKQSEGSEQARWLNGE